MKKIYYTTSYAAAVIGVTVGAIRQWIIAKRLRPDAIAYGAQEQLEFVGSDGLDRQVQINTNGANHLFTKRTIYNAKRAWLAGKL
jgi:hypothetical protein